MDCVFRGFVSSWVFCIVFVFVFVLCSVVLGCYLVCFTLWHWFWWWVCLDRLVGYLLVNILAEESRVVTCVVL